MKAFLIGILSALFFSFTFILNESMSATGGSYLWSSSLRYIFSLPIFFIIVLSKNQVKEVIKSIKENMFQWILWSTIGFGLFYLPLTFASNYGASWLVAATWQITIIAGALMTPFFSKIIKTELGIEKIKNKFPKKFLKISLIILLGVFIVQIENFQLTSLKEGILGIVPVIIAAFSYPLGNRKMMAVCENKLNTFQRILGMTICSMPFWIIVSAYATLTVGLPSGSQMFQSLLVAVFSGVIGTTLFFKATDLVAHNTHKLAIIESTQASEIIFTILGGIIILGSGIPSTIALFGLGLVICGILWTSFLKEDA